MKIFIKNQGGIIFEKKIKTAVIGLGFGKNHADGYYENPSSELKIICDINEEQAKTMAEKYKTIYTTDYKDILSDKKWMQY